MDKKETLGFFSELTCMVNRSIGYLIDNYITINNDTNELVLVKTLDMRQIDALSPGQSIKLAGVFLNVVFVYTETNKTIWATPLLSDQINYTKSWLLSGGK